MNAFLIITFVLFNILQGVYVILIFIFRGKKGNKDYFIF